MRMSVRSDEFINSIVRTSITIFTGAVVVYLIANLIDVDYSLKNPLTEAIFCGVSICYYLIVRILECYVSEHFGWLLFSAGNPTYPTVSWVNTDDEKRSVNRRRRQPAARHAFHRK